MPIKTLDNTIPHTDYPWQYIPTIGGDGELSVRHMDECQYCSQKNSCKTFGGITITSPTGTNPIPADERITAHDIRFLQYWIYKLNRIANGLETEDWLYCGANNSNFIETNWWVILEVDDNRLKLRYDTVTYNDRDPRKIVVGRYQWFDEDMISHWSYSYSEIQPNDYVTFSVDSCLCGRRCPDIIDKDLSGLNDGDNGYFWITLDQDISDALYAGDPNNRTDPLPDPPPEFNVSIKRHGISPEDWDEPGNNDKLIATVKEIVINVADIPEDNWHELKDTGDNSCRIAIPQAGALEGSVRKWATLQVSAYYSGSWHDVSDTYDNTDHVTITQSISPAGWVTKLYLGDINENTEQVYIKYMPEALPGDEIRLSPCLARCNYCKEEYNRVFRHGDEYNSRSFFCSQRSTATGFSTYLPGRCYQYGTCNKFTAGIPWILTSNTIDALWVACNVYYDQDIPGYSYHRNFTIGRSKHPSIGYLLGLHRLESATQLFSKRTFVGHTEYGFYEPSGSPGEPGTWISGAFWEDGDWGTARPQGIVPSNVGSWNTRKNQIGSTLDNTLDPYEMFRAYKFRTQRGVIRDNGAMAGERELHFQRMTDFKAWFPALIKGTDQEHLYYTLQFGDWLHSGKAYAARIQMQALTPYGHDWGQNVKISGYQVEKIEYVGSALGYENVYKIEVSNGEHRWAISNVGEDVVLSFTAGGKVVDPPPWRKIHSFYEVPDEKVIHCPYAKTVAGDTITIDSPYAQEHRFWIIHALAFQGEDQTCQITREIRRRYIPGAFSIPVEDDDTITGVRCFRDAGGGSWVQLTREDSLTKPEEISEDKYWVAEYEDEEENKDYGGIVYLSPDNCRITSGGGNTPGDTIKIEWELNDSGSWNNCTLNDSSTPTGEFTLDIEDADFDLESLTVNNITRDLAMQKTEDLQPDTNQFYVWNPGGDIWRFRWNYNNAFEEMEISWDKEPDVIPDSGAWGMPLGYRDYAGKLDCLWMVDEDEMVEIYGDLMIGSDFEISTAGVIHPSEPVAIYFRGYNSPSEEEVPGADLWIDRGRGIIDISQEWLDNWESGSRCLRVEAKIARRGN